MNLVFFNFNKFFLSRKNKVMNTWPSYRIMLSTTQNSSDVGNTKRLGSSLTTYLEILQVKIDSKSKMYDKREQKTASCTLWNNNDITRKDPLERPQFQFFSFWGVFPGGFPSCIIDGPKCMNLLIERGNFSELYGNTYVHLNSF